MPVNVRGTAGTVADCTQAAALLDGIPLDAAATEYLLADRGYDTNQVAAMTWPGVATRYAKNAAAYLAISRIRALAIWAQAI